MALNIKDSLHERVCNAQSTNDLIPLLELIPLQIIKVALLQAVHNWDRNINCSLSLTDIVPQDIIQYIVSFTDSLDMKYINKSFNSCYNKNRTMEFKQRQRIIDAQEFIPNIKYEQHNQTWIIHPTRTHLNNEEIAKGYKGPINAMDDVCDTIRAGDKLLFYDGIYVEEDSEFGFLEDDLQIIGIGDEVVMKIRATNQTILVSHKLYLKNIKLEMGDGFLIHDNGAVSMEDCQITTGSSCIEVWNGSLNAKNCLFDNDEGDVSPIQGYYGSYDPKINIIGCTFTGYKETCIWLFDESMYPTDPDDGPYGDGVLKCVGSIFEDNCGYPIAIQMQSISIEAVIAHNVLEGYNGVNVNCAVNTANKIY
eukprot:184996_1